MILLSSNKLRIKLEEEKSGNEQNKFLNIVYENLGNCMCFCIMVQNDDALNFFVMNLLFSLAEKK